MTPAKRQQICRDYRIAKTEAVCAQKRLDQAQKRYELVVTEEDLEAFGIKVTDAIARTKLPAWLIKWVRSEAQKAKHAMDQVEALMFIEGTIISLDRGLRGKFYERDRDDPMPKRRKDR